MTSIPPDRWLEEYIEGVGVEHPQVPSCWIARQQGYRRKQEKQTRPHQGLQKGASPVDRSTCTTPVREMKVRDFSSYSMAGDPAPTEDILLHAILTGSPKKDVVILVVS